MICLPMAANGNRLNAITSCWFGRLRANRRVAPAPEPGACPLKEKRQFLVKSENNYYLCEPKGEVQEWLKWPAWKASKPLKGFRGSNPLLSATNAENQQIAKQTPSFTPKNVKSGVFVLFKIIQPLHNKRVAILKESDEKRLIFIYPFTLIFQDFTSS